MSLAETSTDWRDRLVLLGTAACGVQLPFAGQFLLGELMFFIVVPAFLRDTAIKPLKGWMKWTTAALVAWVFGTILAAGLADNIYGALTGLARILFLAVDLIAISFWCTRCRNRNDSYSPLFAAAGIAFLIYNLYDLERFQEYPWKFGFGLGVSFFLISAALYLGRVGRLLTSYVVFATAIVLNIALSFRSMALVLFVAILLFVWRVPRQFVGGLFRALGVVVVGVIFAYAFGNLAASGTLGSDAQEKVEQQVGNSVTPIRLMLGGRKEVVSSYLLISKSPILGYGNQHALTDYESEQFSRYFDQEQLPLTYADVVRFSPGKPYLDHSVMLGSWVESGFFAVPAMVLFVSVLGLGFVLREPYGGAASYAVLALSTWTFLFSPLGGTSRLTLALGLAIVVVSMSTRLTTIAAPRKDATTRSADTLAASRTTT